MGQVSKQSFCGHWCTSKRVTYLHAAAACCLRSVEFFYGSISFAETVPKKLSHARRKKTGSAFFTAHTETKLTFDPIILFPGLRASGDRCAWSDFFFIYHFVMPRCFLWVGARMPAGTALQTAATPKLQLFKSNFNLWTLLCNAE